MVPNRPRAGLSRFSRPDEFRRLAIVNVAALWLIMVSGALVRLTGSGLGCPDWPLCDGGVVPERNMHQFIEYGNRVASAMVVAVAVLTWIAARGYRTRRRGILHAARGAALMSIAQMPLGGLTVLTGLHPLMVGAHFLLSVAALTAGVLLVISVFDDQRGIERRFDGHRGPFAILAAAALAVVIVTGVMVTAAGPHSGDDDVLNRFGDLQVVAWVHVRAVGVMLVLMGVLALWLRRERSGDPWIGRVGAVFAGLLAVQITLGEIQYRQGLPWQVVSAHVSVAGLVWVSGVATTWMAARPGRRTSATREVPQQADAVAGSTR